MQGYASGVVIQLRMCRGKFSGRQTMQKYRHSRVRSEVNSELNFSPNFEGLVLGCIDADFCK